MTHRQLESNMLWVPLCGSAVGSLLGGLLADWMIRRIGGGSYHRSVVAAAGTLIALPIVVMGLFAGYPACFVCLWASGLVGEVYLGQALAIVTGNVSCSC